MDKIRPLKIESLSQGSQDDNGYPTELNPSEDYVSCKGISLENSDNHIVDKDPITGQLRFKDEYSGERLLSVLLERNRFEYDSNDDITLFETDQIFESDGNGDMMPSLQGTKDEVFEIISGEITPKA